MNELTELLNSSEPIHINKLCKYLFDQYTNLKLSPGDFPTFFSKISPILSNNQSKIAEKYSECPKVLLTIFLIAYQLSPESIAFNFPFGTENGYLYASSLVLYANNSQEKEYLQFFQNILSKNINVLFNIQSADSQQPQLFAFSICNYFRIIPAVIGDHILDSQFSQILTEILKKICELDSKSITLSAISFISEVFKSIKNCLMTNLEISLPSYFLDSVISIITTTQKYPSMCLSTFFHTWFFLVKKCLETHHTQSLLALVPTVTKCFEKVSSYRNHELHRSFPWYLCYWFYDFLQKEEHSQKVQVLSLICNGVRTEPRMNSIHRQAIENSVKRFVNSIVSQCFENQPYYLYYVITSLNSSLEMLIYKMKKIHAFGQTSPKKAEKEDEFFFGYQKSNQKDDAKNGSGEINADFEHKPKITEIQSNMRKRRISFFEQSNFSPEGPVYDRYLYSISHEKDYESEQECSEDFEQMCRTCDIIFKYIQSIEIIYEQIIISLKKALFQEIESNPDVNHSLTISYLVSIFSTMFKFMIHATHKQMEIQSFLNKEINSSKLNTRKILDFTEIYGIFFSLFEDVPPFLYAKFADVIMREILSNIDKGILTLFLIETLAVINKDKINSPNSIISLALNVLIEIASTKTSYLMSKDANNVNMLYFTIFFAIRLATFNGKNICFGMTLRLYQKLLISTVMTNTKFIFHQAIAMRLIYHYNMAVDENSINQKFTNLKMPGNFKSFRFKISNLDEIELNAQFYAINSVLDIYAEEAEYMPISSLIPILDAAFSSNEIHLIEKSARICLQFFKNEDPEKWLSDSDIVKRLFTQFFDSSKVITDLSLASEILELLPKYAHVYLHNPPLMGNEQKVRFQMKDLDIDLLEVLKTISLNMDCSDEEIKHIFALVSTGFEVVLDSVVHNDLTISQTLLQLIIMLKYCFGFECLSKSLKNLTSFITKSFGDLFIRSESDLYIICVLDAMGMNRLDSTLVIMNLAVSFFDYCKGKPINPLFVSNTFDKLFFFFPLSTRLFSILGGFSLGINYYPEFISLNQVRSFLIQTTEVNSNDSAFIKILNNFLKEFLSQNDYQVQKDFVALVYEIICPLSISVRIVLEKRVSKLGIPISINSLDEILNSTNEYFLLYQKLTLAFLCGIKGNLLENLNMEWVNRVIKFMNSSNLDGINRLEKYVRVISLLKSILRLDEIFRFFTSNSNEFIVLTVKILCQTLISHYPPIQKGIRKCFSILISRYPKEIGSIRQIDDFWKNYTKIPISVNGVNRIIFCTQLSKIFPEKVSEEIIHFLMNEIASYVESSDADKMNNVTIFVKILEQLKVKKLINQENIRYFILNKYNEEGITYINFYINCVLILYRDTLIPFRSLFVKPVVKFLRLFPEQTINYLINFNRDNSLCSFAFLEYLIIYDQKDIFYNSFLDVFQSEHDFSSFSPSTYKIFQSLTLQKRFIFDNRLLFILKNEFSLVIRSIINPLKIYENEYELLSILADSLLNVFSENFELKPVIKLAALFHFSFFLHSSIYKKYISIVFHPSKIDKISLIFHGILDNKSPAIKAPIVSIILPNCIKSLPVITNEEVEAFFRLNYFNSNESTMISIALRCARALVSKVELSQEYIKEILIQLKKCFNSPDIDVIVYSLKLCVKLSEKKLLPLFTFESILKQIFSYPKFFESPFSSYCVSLMKSRPDYIEQLSPSTIEIISFFFYDKFFCFRDVQKFITVILPLAKVIKLLPFSLFTSISSILDQRISEINSNLDQRIPDATSIPSDIVEILFFSCRLYMNWEPNEKEKDYFFKIGFKFVRVLLNQHDSLNLSKYTVFLDNFFTFLIENDSFNPEHFPVDLLKSIKEVEDNLTFDIICTSAHFIPKLLYENHFDLIQKALIFASKEKIESTIQIPLFVDLLKFIYSDQEIFNHFSYNIYYLIDNLIQRYSLQNNEFLFTLVNSLIYHHYDSDFLIVISKLFALFDQLIKASNSPLYSLLFEMILKLLEIMPEENQMSYFMNIYENTNWTPLLKNIYTKLVHSLIECQKISIDVKMHIFDSFPDLLLGTPDELEKIIKAINEFGQLFGIQVVHHVIYIKIIMASISSPSERLIYFDQIEKLLFFNFNERLKFFIHNLPIVLWSDDYFIYIVALLTEKVKIWQPIFAFSSRLKDVSDLLAIAAIKKFLDDDISCELQQFLKQLLKSPKNVRKNYGKVISSILQIFFRTDFFLPYSLAYKASCVSGDFEFDRYFFRPTDICQKRFVLPECRNHFYYGFYLPQLTRNQACAGALTLLHQYDIAEYFYKKEEPTDSNCYYGQIRMVNRYLVEPQKLSYAEIIRPLIKINMKNDFIAIQLEKAANSYFKQNKQEVVDLVNEIKTNLLQDFCSHQFSSIYQNERTIVIEVLCSNLLKLCEMDEVGNEIEVMKKFSCLNPSFVSVVNDFNSLLRKETTLPKEIIIEDDKEPPCVIVSRMDFNRRFQKVTGITPHGLYALNSEQINEFYNEISSKMVSGKMEIKDWIAFAPFCFNIFIANQSLEYFASAYFSYYNIFTFKDNINSVIRKDASARIVTLIRIAERNEKKNFKKPILETSMIFHKSYAEIWRFWLQQLVELAHKKWFRDIAMDLFCEMTYRSTLYAKKSSSKDLQDNLRSEIALRNNFIQISMMEKIEKIVNQFYEINEDEFEYQRIISNFIEESFKLPDEEISRIDLMEERKRKNIQAKFGLSLSHLMKEDIEKIGSFSEWISELRKLNKEELELFIKQFTNSTETFSKQRESIEAVIDNFNNQLPFIFPIHLDHAPQLSIFRFDKNISYLLPDLIVCRATTSTNSHNTFLIQKSHNKNGLKASVITLSTCFSIFRIILQNTYASRMRSINLAVSFCFEIGENTLLMQLMSYPITLKNLFEKETMMRQKDWVKKFTKDGQITEEGLENVKTFTKDSLEKYHEKTMPEKTFLCLRRGMAESYAAAVVIRYMLSARYQDLGRIFACTEAAEIPVLLTDFDYAESFLNETDHSTFRLSPTMQMALGPQVTGELFLSMSSVAFAFTSHLESIRAYIELIVGDEMDLQKEGGDDDPGTIDEMIRRRSIVENRFISLSPPRPKIEKIDECLKWHDNLMAIIEKSKDPFAQPAYTIPWF